MNFSMNKILGTFLVIGALICGIFTATIDFGWFIDIISFGFVVIVGGGLTYMRKNFLSGNALYKILKENFILSGWLGTLSGIIVMLTGFGGEGGGLDTLFVGLSAALLTAFYGYVLGYLIESYLYE